MRGRRIGEARILIRVGGAGQRDASGKTWFGPGYSRQMHTKLSPLRHNDPVSVDPPIIRAPEKALRHFAQALAVLALASAAGAQESAWPSRTIQIVVPYTPGTGADILARILGPKLAERWKIAVVTDNRAGASGNIGTDFVAKSAPDGYTLLCTATSFGTNPAINQKLPFDPVKSFAPVILLATSTMAVIVTQGLPAKSMREFLELARGQPGKLYYSSPGNGGPQHLAMELLKLDARIDLVHVPYKGSGGALADLVGGHVQAMIVSLQTAAPYVQSGKLRMLAVMSAERSQAFSEVPTLKELGLADLVGGHVQAMIVSLQTAAPYVQSGKLRMLSVMSAERSPAFPDVPTLKELGLPDLEVDTWYGMFAPAGTPGAVVAKLNAELNPLLKQPEIRELLAKQGMAAAGGTPERFGDLVKRELARWSRVVAKAGIKAD